MLYSNTPLGLDIIIYFYLVFLQLEESDIGEIVFATQKPL